MVYLATKADKWARISIIVLHTVVVATLNLRSPGDRVRLQRKKCKGDHINYGYDPSVLS